MLTQGPSDRDLAKERLLSLCESDSRLIMEEYNVTREHLKCHISSENIVRKIKKDISHIREGVHASILGGYVHLLKMNEKQRLIFPLGLRLDFVSGSTIYNRTNFHC